MNTISIHAVIDSYSYDKSGKREVGVIAQDIQRALPEAVEIVETPNGEFLGVNYGSIASLAIAAINELNQQVKELRGEIEMLKAS
ncbi:tail fiber domain-containing protein [Aeromonas hydrophila]|uniref:tail fiber domain-containing protein n=1 Tax=Aeromonas hydrophila TaxID=644 RepID=UPI002B46640A|nr:tail fiber domain-containing protein [Aeromonas hydrophila]